MKNAAKKNWVQPELIIIGQGTPEENILKHCKSNGGSGGPTISQSNCNEEVGNCAACKSNGGGAS